MNSRRSFLQSTAALAALGPFAPWQALAAATGDGGGGSYRALVCLFMFGGSDAHNMVVPTEPAAHARYAQARPRLALARESLLPLAGTGWGAHPALAPLVPLWAAGQAALVANIGPLVVPTSKAQYLARSVPLPAQLFSHSDQQNAWQSGLVDQAARHGWGGRLLERLVSAGQANRGYSAIGLSGSNLWEGGDFSLQPYRVSSSGRFGFDFYDPKGSDALSRAINGLLAESRDDPFEQTWLEMMGRSIENQRVLTAALGTSTLRTAFPDTGLGRQLQMAARLIAARSALGLSRQCFFCSTGGFDTHGDDQLQRQAEGFAEIAGAVAAFQAAMVELGVSRQVTLFTASDFGRTLASNGAGTDHGWGAHHWVVGGAVRGGRIVGRMPEAVLGGPDDIGQGVWLPTTSVDQLGGELAAWYGADAATVDEVFPRLAGFDPAIGLMGPAG